jgi:hypothetical protein
LRPVKRSEQSLFKLVWHQLRFRRHKELIGPSEAAPEQVKARPFAIRVSQRKALGHSLADIRQKLAKAGESLGENWVFCGSCGVRMRFAGGLTYA